MSGPEDRLCSLTPDSQDTIVAVHRQVRIRILDSERMIGASRLFNIKLSNSGKNLNHLSKGVMENVKLV